MNDLVLSISNMKSELSRYLEHGKYKLTLKTVLLLLSAMMIYLAGKNMGELIFHMSN